MVKQSISTQAGAPPAGAYSQGIQAGDFLFISGQGPVDPISGQVAGNTIEEQTARTLENLRAILEASGATLADVVKVTVYLSDIALFERYNRIYATYFPDPKPARTTIGAPLKDILIEMDAIAYLGKG